MTHPQSATEPGLIELCEQLMDLGTRMELADIGAKTKPCDLCAKDELGCCYWHDNHPLTRRTRSLELQYAKAMLSIVKPADPNN
jgi:hypothetical protein